MVVFKNVHPQEFPFRSSIMYYIFKNANPELFKKFNKSCKFIFAKFQLIPVNTLPYHKPVKANFWITEELEWEKVDTTFYKRNVRNVARCSIKQLILIDCDNFMFKEFEFLNESGNVELLHLVRTKVVFSDNGNLVPMEQLMNRALKATSIILEPPHVTSKTMDILCSTKRPMKFNLFHLFEIDGPLNPNQFFKFIMENADQTIIRSPGYKFSYYFTNKERDQEFFNTVDQMLKDNGI